MHLKKWKQDAQNLQDEFVALCISLKAFRAARCAGRAAKPRAFLRGRSRCAHAYAPRLRPLKSLA